MPKNICILSPHLDDALLNCCEFISDWKSKHFNVKVVTVFSNFQEKKIPSYSQQLLKKLNIKSAQAYKKIRTLEDFQAFSYFGITPIHLGFTDAGFRGNDRLVFYPTPHHLHTGLSSDHDAMLVEAIQKKLLSIMDNIDIIVVPFGIGKHIDHLITRKTVEVIFQNKKIWYYLDFPYALRARYWTKDLFFSFLTKKIDFKRTTDNKRKILNQYKTQIPLLFPNKIPNYFEVILS